MESAERGEWTKAALGVIWLGDHCSDAMLPRRCPELEPDSRSKEGL